MWILKFSAAFLVVAYATATGMAKLLAFEWPWDGEGVIGFIFTLALLILGAMPVLFIMKDKISLPLRPTFTGVLVGLVGYPAAFAIFSGIAEALRPLGLGTWFWPLGLILISAVAIGACCWLLLSAMRFKAPRA